MGYPLWRGPRRARNDLPYTMCDCSSNGDRAYNSNLRDNARDANNNDGLRGSMTTADNRRDANSDAHILGNLDWQCRGKIQPISYDGDANGHSIRSI